MLNFSNEFIIENNSIQSKDLSKKYEISEKVYKVLKKYYDDNFAKFDKNLDFCKYLLKEKIVIEDDYCYNPFTKNQKIKRVFVQLTEKCNLKCKHCYASAGPYEKHSLNINELKEFLLKAIEYGVTNIDFTGGEIFTCPYLLDLLQFLDKFPVTIVLFTNLTLLGDNEVEKLKSIKSIRKIVTSLDYFTPEKHNEFRQGKNAFQSTLNNINRLKKYGFNIVVNSIVLDDNHDEIAKLADFLVNEIGVSINIDNLMYEGRMSKEEHTNTKEKENALVVSTIFNQINENESINLNKKNILNDNYSHKYCGVGQSMIYLTSTGDIALCPSLTNFKMQKKFDEITNFFEIEQFISTFNNVGCKHTECNRYQDCNHGCRARAFLMSGDLCERDMVYCYRLGKC